jgi:hypothetical protein
MAADLLAFLTPENITLLAYVTGAFLIGVGSLVGLFWLGDSFDRWF